METLTINQIKEIHLMIITSSDLLNSVEGIARLAKRVQIYLGGSYKEAVEVLSEVVNEFTENA